MSTTLPPRLARLVPSTDTVDGKAISYLVAMRAMAEKRAGKTPGTFVWFVKSAALQKIAAIFQVNYRTVFRAGERLVKAGKLKRIGKREGYVILEDMW